MPDTWLRYHFTGGTRNANGASSFQLPKPALAACPPFLNNLVLTWSFTTGSHPFGRKMRSLIIQICNYSVIGGE